jgi:cell division protein FtsN
MRQKYSGYREIYLDSFRLVLFMGGLVFFFGVVFYLGVLYGKNVQHLKVAHGEKQIRTVQNILPPVEFTFAEDLMEEQVAEEANFWEEPMVQNDSLASVQSEETYVEEENRLEEFSDELPQAQYDQVAMSLPTVSENGNYAVQVAAFQSREEAEKMILQLQGEEFSAYSGPTHYSSKGRWYRVWVGDFFEKDEAKEIAKQLSKFTQTSPFVVTTTGRMESQSRDSQQAHR